MRLIASSAFCSGSHWFNVQGMQSCRKNFKNPKTHSLWEASTTTNMLYAVNLKNTTRKVYSKQKLSVRNSSIFELWYVLLTRRTHNSAEDVPVKVSIADTSPWFPKYPRIPKKDPGIWLCIPNSLTSKNIDIWAESPILKGPGCLSSASTQLQLSTKTYSIQECSGHALCHSCMATRFNWLSSLVASSSHPFVV